jgi:hypothetical protein
MGYGSGWSMRSRPAHAKSGGAMQVMEPAALERQAPTKRQQMAKRALRPEPRHQGVDYGSRRLIAGHLVSQPIVATYASRYGA